MEKSFDAFSTLSINFDSCFNTMYMNDNEMCVIEHGPGTSLDSVK